MDTNSDQSTSAKQSQAFEYFGDSDDSVQDPDFILHLSDEESEQARYSLSIEEEDDDEGKISQMAVNSETHVPEDASATVSVVSEKNINKSLTRKRKRQPERWKMNINKKLCQRGKEHKDVKGKIQRGRNLKMLKNCETACRYLCNRKISSEGRQRIFESFWELSNDSKGHFYAKNTERIETVRKQTPKAESRRKYTFKYYFHVEDVKFRVCKVFFLSTLDISQQRINYFHEEKKDKITGIPKESRQGCHVKKVISNTEKDFVRLHINQLPRVESHYCRVDTKKEYLSRYSFSFFTLW